MEYLDPWTSRAFAVADHQVAHVYVARPGRPSRGPRPAAPSCPGSDEVLDRDGQGRGTAWTTRGPASWCCVAEPDAWFTYYYWLDDARAPDFARGVEIHRKPGYDPAELFFDPADRLVKARAGAEPGAQEGRPALHDERGAAGPGAASRGSHGRLPDDAGRRAGAALLRPARRRAGPLGRDRRQGPAAPARRGGADVARPSREFAKRARR